LAIGLGGLAAIGAANATFRSTFGDRAKYLLVLDSAPKEVGVAAERLRKRPGLVGARAQSGVVFQDPSQFVGSR
jgi:hypothetical protein